MSDATALAAAIAEGRTTARAVMEASLAACAAQADLGAVVYRDDTLARASADAADRHARAPRGAFHGVPFLAKDLGARARGLPATAGAAALRRRAIAQDSDDALFTAFRDAGLLPFGVTAVPPFGLALSCEPEELGPARNPWNTALTPGGSSGGAAAAVAAGLVAMAHATDAAGSIRVPAACCGLVGLKPSRGAIPGGPDYGNHLMGLASELVLARSVRDVQRAFTSVHRPLAPLARLTDSPRIALALPDRCDPAQNVAARDAARALTDAGCRVHEIAAPDQLGAEAHALARMILAVSLADWLSALEIADDQVPPLAAALAAEGRALPATALFAASREIARLSERAAALFADADALICPVLSTAPPALGATDLTQTDVEAHFAAMEAFAPNAALANVAGLAALALPFGTANGLPRGVQLIGRAGSDLDLCHLASLIEARAPALSYPNPIAGMPA